MADADKCYLRIPFKEWAKNQDGISREAAEQEFQNLKEIERRINDPECVGEGCTCSYVALHSDTFVTSGDGTIHIATGSPGTSSSQITSWTIMEGGDGWTISDPFIIPPTPGLFIVGGFSFLDDSSGTDPVQTQTAINNSTSYTTAYGASFSPAGFGIRNGIGGLVRTSDGDPNIAGFMGLVAGASGATRSFDARASSGFGTWVSLTAVCGCH